jgi:hypothetical protein
MLNRPSVVELREALAALAPRVFSGDATIDSAFRKKLGAAVDELRLLGWPPEQVIIAVKQTADDAGLPASRNVLRTAGDLTPNDAALQQLVRYCIEHYYGVKLAS